MILWYMYTSIAILVLNLIINGPIFLAMHYYLWDSQTGSYTIAKIAQWVRILVSSFIIFSTYPVKFSALPTPGTDRYM